MTPDDARGYDENAPPGLNRVRDDTAPPGMASCYDQNSG